jgi:hypothetical protein
MVHGDPEETRAYARLPGLDIAVVHRRGARAGGGTEEVMVALRAAPSFAALARPFGTVDPLSLWMGLGQAMWATWLGCLAAASAPPPWIGRGD